MGTTPNETIIIKHTMVKRFFLLSDGSIQFDRILVNIAIINAIMVKNAVIK